MQKNHWTLKDSEVQQTLQDYGIDLKEYDRKVGIAAIIDFEKKIESGDIVLEGSKKDALAELKKEMPKLMLTRVIFHNTMENDMPYIFVGHNGKGYYIPRETEVDVPDYILNSCIKDAIEERLIPVQQMNGDILWTKKKIQRFPYSIVKPSFAAE
jgi:ribosomal protein S4E